MPPHMIPPPAPTPLMLSSHPNHYPSLQPHSDHRCSSAFPHLAISPNPPVVPHAHRDSASEAAACPPYKSQYLPISTVNIRDDRIQHHDHSGPPSNRRKRVLFSNESRGTAMNVGNGDQGHEDDGYDNIAVVADIDDQLSEEDVVEVIALSAESLMLMDTDPHPHHHHHGMVMNMNGSHASSPSSRREYQCATMNLINQSLAPKATSTYTASTSTNDADNYNGDTDDESDESNDLDLNISLYGPNSNNKLEKKEKKRKKKKGRSISGRDLGRHAEDPNMHLSTTYAGQYERQLDECKISASNAASASANAANNGMSGGTNYGGGKAAASMAAGRAGSRGGSSRVVSRVYVCPEEGCVHHEASRALGDLTGMRKHYSRKHGVRRWPCPRCPKAYALRSDLVAHSKTCGNRHFLCDSCGHTFPRRDKLSKHRDYCRALAQEKAKATNCGPSQVNNALFHSNYVSMPEVDQNLVQAARGESKSSASPPPPPLHHFNVINYLAPDLHDYSSCDKPYLSLDIHQASLYANPNPNPSPIPIPIPNPSPKYGPAHTDQEVHNIPGFHPLSLHNPKYIPPLIHQPEYNCHDSTPLRHVEYTPTKNSNDHTTTHDFWGLNLSV